MLRVALAAWMIVSAAAYADQTVEGRVIDVTTGAGIPDVDLRLAIPNLADGPDYYTTTDMLGHFQIENVQPGTYTAMYNAANFSHPPDFRNPSFKVTAGANPVYLELKLAPGGKVSGHVMDMAGKPVPNAQIQIQSIDGLSFMAIRADDKGEYQTPGVLSPAVYIVSASAPPDAKAPDSPPDQRLGWAQTYYPHATDQQLAARLALAPGGEIQADIKLAAIPVHSIRGVVLDPHGDRIPMSSVRLSPAVSSSPFGLPGLAKEGKGTFEFESASTGEWILSTTLLQAGEILWATKTVQVKDQDLEDIQLKLVAPFSIQGKIVMETPEGQAAPKAPGVRLAYGPIFASGFRLPLVQALSLPGNGFYPGVLDDKGNFTVADLYPGPYHIIPELSPAGYYLESIKLGGADALDFAVPIESPALPLTITYKRNGGTVRGTVESCNAGTVLLIPQTLVLRRDGFIRQTKCEDGGHFEILNVRPGEYYGFAVAPEDPAGRPGAPMDQTLMNQSVRVSVRGNESTLADLRLIAR